MAQKIESKLSLPMRSINNNWKNKCIKLMDDLEKTISYSALSSDADDLMKTKLQSESSLSEIQEEIKYLQRRKSELDIETQDKPNKKPELALYQLITKLTWDLECPENHVKGFVAKKPFKVFDMDVTKHSEQEVIDKLWALIDSKK